MLFKRIRSLSGNNNKRDCDSADYDAEKSNWYLTISKSIEFDSDEKMFRFQKEFYELVEKHVSEEE